MQSILVEVAAWDLLFLKLRLVLAVTRPCFFSPLLFPGFLVTGLCFKGVWYIGVWLTSICGSGSRPISSWFASPRGLELNWDGGEAFLLVI